MSGSIATVISYLLATQSSEATRPCAHAGMSSQVKGLNLWLTEATQRGARTTRIDISQLKASPTPWSLPACPHRRQNRFWQKSSKSLVAYESLTTPVQIEGSTMPIDWELTMLASHGRAKIPDGDRPLGTHPASSLRRRTTPLMPDGSSSMFRNQSRTQSVVDVHLVSHDQRFTPVPRPLSQALRVSNTRKSPR